KAIADSFVVVADNEFDRVTGEKLTFPLEPGLAGDGSSFAHQFRPRPVPIVRPIAALAHPADEIWDAFGRITIGPKLHNRATILRELRQAPARQVEQEAQLR